MNSNQHNTANEWLLLGVGTPYVYEVFECLQRDGIGVHAFVDNLNQSSGPDDIGKVINLNDLPENSRSLNVAIPLLTPGHRKSIVSQALQYGFNSFPFHLDPSSVIASSVQISEGVLVNAHATVGALTQLGPFVIVNRDASVGHHVKLEEFATLGPNCTLCGSSVIGKGAFIGAAAVINPKVNIGSNCIVGAGAVVVQDVPDSCIAVGNPAKIIRTDIQGYNDVSV